MVSGPKAMIGVNHRLSYCLIQTVYHGVIIMTNDSFEQYVVTSITFIPTFIPLLFSTDW